MKIWFEIPIGGSLRNWGNSNSTNTRKFSQLVTAQTSAKLAKVITYQRKLNNPTDNVNLKIYEGGASPEAGTLLSTTSIDGSTFPTSIGAVEFILATPVSVTAGTDYYFTITRDTPDDTDRYQFDYKNTNTYDHSKLLTYTVLTGWTDNTDELRMTIESSAQNTIMFGTNF
jgi:hypothetical protein